jgi:hypothetical protein
VIVGFALAAHFIARQVLVMVASRGRPRALAAADAVVFAFQVPAVWLYARFLGSDLSI